MGQIRKSSWFLLAALIVGCGQQPQVDGEQRDLILRLATGTSTRDPGIIDRAAVEVEQLEGESEAKDAFRSIIVAARAGDWDRAQALAYALRDGQHPTAEDRERVAKRTVREIKKVGAKPASPGDHAR